jgi:hypothetical protein
MSAFRKSGYRFCDENALEALILEYDTISIASYSGRPFAKPMSRP